MNTRRFTTIFLLTVITISGVAILLNSAMAADNDASGAKSVNSSTAQSEGSSTQQSALSTPEISAVKVTAEKVSKEHTSVIELTGTVKANDQVKVFATSSGQLAKILATEGQKIKKGDPLFVIAGVNGTKPIALIQLEIAQKNYDTAKQGLEITKQGNEATLRVAELQLESARHAMQGAEIDLQVIDRNIGGVNNGLFYLNDSLNATGTNNDLSLEKAQNGIDSLKDAINDLEEQRAYLARMIDEQSAISDNGDDAAQPSESGEDPGQPPTEGNEDPSAPADQQTAAPQTDTQLAELDKAIEELYTQLQNARIGYEQLEQAKTLTENQILSQISQTETQGMALNLNRTSAETKMGLRDGAPDAVELAEEGVNGALIKNRASLLQAQTQLAMAASNLEMAKIQADSLMVRAPIDGVVSEIGANEGDLVSQQSMLTQVSGLNNFELRTFVDADSADLITPGSYAEVMIGGRFVKLPVKSVGAFADPATKLVPVSISLPKTGFRANQSLKVRLSLEHGNSTLDADSFFIPLDALIIGTEETYVFTANDGFAHRKVVETGEMRGDQVEITGGLSADDLIITEGSKTILENQPVELSR